MGSASVEKLEPRHKGIEETSDVLVGSTFRYESATGKGVRSVCPKAWPIETLRNS